MTQLNTPVLNLSRTPQDLYLSLLPSKYSVPYHKAAFEKHGEFAETVPLAHCIRWNKISSVLFLFL